MTEDPDQNTAVIDDIVTACKRMGATKTGALIAIKRDGSLDFLKNTGDTKDIVVNFVEPIMSKKRLNSCWNTTIRAKTPAPVKAPKALESISIFRNSALHDGAMIIEDNKITATRVILPVSDNRKIPQRFGLRHRAALGLTERSNALALIVSEETGQISLVIDGAFESYDNMEELAAKIKNHLD